MAEHIGYGTRADDGCRTLEGAGLIPGRPELMSPRELGREGERIAGRYLELQGWEILERNWTCPFGEADLIARDAEGACVLVEVKTRLAWGERSIQPPEFAVTEEKQRRYLRMANYYMTLADVEALRFDVIAVSVVVGHTVKLHHIVSAYGCDL